MNKNEKKEEKQRMRAVTTGTAARATSATRIVTALAVLSCLLLPYGCSSDGLPDDGQQGAANNEPVPVSITDASLDAGTISDAPTRAAANSSLAVNGKQVKMFLIDGGNVGTKYANRYQELYTYNSSAGAWGAAKPFYVDSRKALIYGVYDPNNNVTFQTNSTKTAAAANLSAQANDDAKLWYYGTPGTLIYNSNAKVNIIFKCAYSRLTLSLSKTADYPNPCKVSNVTFRPTVGSFYTTAIVDITNGLLSGGSYTSSYAVNTTKKSMYTSGLTTAADTSIDLLFPAQKLAAKAGLNFTLTVDDRNYSVTVPAEKFNEFKRGVRHTANLVMSGAGIIVSSVTTTDWPSVSNTNVDSKFD